jgi:CRISPR-associated protein Cmr6
LLAERTGRVANLARFLGGQSLRFNTTSRFATGLGREHPIENGFVWHPSLGVPYLPGSAVKGLVRAWVEGGWSGETIDPATFHQVFGSDYRRGSGQDDAQRGLAPQMGAVIFFDALPAAPVQLKADVMTPHYGDYYEKGAMPGDWLSPNPIPFLTVAFGQSFQFALAPNATSEQNKRDCALAAQWLESALIWMGAGAKTAVGYGRFERDQKAEESVQKQQQDADLKTALNARLAKLDPIARELEASALAEKWDQDKNAFTKEGVIEGWLIRLETIPNADAIHRLRDLVNHHFPGLLANPEKTEGKKNKPAFKSRQRQFAPRLNALLNKAP